MDADFQGARLSKITISIYNRGDAGDLAFPQWSALVTNSVAGLDTLTKVQHVVEGQQASDAVRAYAITWPAPQSQYALEYSRTKEVKSLGHPVSCRVHPPGRDAGAETEELHGGGARGVRRDAAKRV